nr:unnamed protein product [Spirometra erinaceieuropaei]
MRMTKAIPGADHRLAISKMRIHPQPRRAPQASQSSSRRRRRRLRGEPIVPTAERSPTTTLAVLGHARRQKQDWLDENDAAISNLLAEKNRLHKAYVTRPTDENRAAFCRLVHQRLRERKDAWTILKA